MPKSQYPSQITSLKTINNEIMVGLNNGTIHTKNFSFTAHEKEFDTLESTDIPERINDFFWVDSGSFYHKFISCNDKFIGVNKVRENYCANDIICNKIDRSNTKYLGKPVKLIKNAHHYNIESLSNHQDYFISTDYLRINMWNVHKLTKCYNLLDCKPSRFEEMEYIITKGTLQNNLFSYSTSNGEIFLNDLRIKNNRQLRIELPRRDDLYEEILRMVHDYIILSDKLVVRDMNSVHFFDLRTNSHIKSIILTKYTNEYLENQFTSNTFGNYKLTNQNNNFYTGGKDGMVYKIDWEYNLYSYDLNLKEDVELISVNDEKVYCGIKECLYEILEESFI